MRRRTRTTAPWVVLPLGLVEPLMSLFSVLIVASVAPVRLEIMGADEDRAGGGLDFRSSEGRPAHLPRARPSRPLRPPQLVEWLDSAELHGPLPAVVAARREETIQLDRYRVEFSWFFLADHGPALEIVEVVGMRPLFGGAWGAGAASRRGCHPGGPGPRSARALTVDAGP
jgi:hypothetical protein